MEGDIFDLLSFYNNQFITNLKGYTISVWNENILM